jgi:hypothetical protein
LQTCLIALCIDLSGSSSNSYHRTFSTARRRGKEQRR